LSKIHIFEVTIGRDGLSGSTINWCDWVFLYTSKKQETCELYIYIYIYITLAMCYAYQTQTLEQETPWWEQKVNVVGHEHSRIGKLKKKMDDLL